MVDGEGHAHSASSTPSTIDHRPSTAALLPLVLLLTAHAATAETVEVRAYQHANGAYEYFDLSGTFLGQAIPNTRDSYDYYDRAGAYQGFSSAPTTARVEFHDAEGHLFRFDLLMADGTQIQAGPHEEPYKQAVPNYRGGADIFLLADPGLTAVGSTVPGEYQLPTGAGAGGALDE